MKSGSEEYNSNFLNELGEAYRAVHQLGEAVEQYKEFGTKDDIKSIAASRPAADSAYQTLIDLQSRSAEYVIGASMAEDEEAGDAIVETHNLINRYQDLRMEIAEIKVEASRDFGMDVDGMSRSIAAHNDRYDEGLYEKVDEDQLVDMIGEMAEEIDFDVEVEE